MSQNQENLARNCGVDMFSTTTTTITTTNAGF